jgi:hypothetical protein
MTLSGHYDFSGCQIPNTQFCGVTAGDYVASVRSDGNGREPVATALDNRFGFPGF